MTDIAAAVTAANQKLDSIGGVLSGYGRRLDDMEVSLRALVASQTMVAENIGSMALEIGRLANAVDKEPPEDSLGDLLRRLSQAVEGNTRATEAVVAVLRTPPASPAA